MLAKNTQQFAKIVIAKSKTWAVLKKIEGDKMFFAVYTISSKGDRSAKKLFEANTKDSQPMYWKFYLPSALELKINEDVEVALDNDKKDWGVVVDFNSGQKAFDSLKKIMSNPLEIKTLLDKAFSKEEAVLRRIIEKAYPEVSEARYNKAGWFIK